jgi:hypothetical protein
MRGPWRPGEQQQRDDADRKVEHEDEPPARQAEQAADDRPGRGRDRSAQGPDADPSGPSSRLVVGMPDQRHGRGHRDRRGRTLHETRGHEDGDGGRQRARGGREHEDRDADAEGRTRAPAVGQRSGRQQQCGEHQGVAVHDPLQPGQRAAQIGPDRG